MEKEFIRNTLDVEVDGLKGENRYIVSAMYNLISDDNVATLKMEIIEDVILTWDEIERDGGLSGVLKDLKECYQI